VTGTSSATGQPPDNTLETLVNLILTLVIAFPLGLLMSSRLAAQLVNACIFLFGYVSIAVLLLLEWAAGDEQAFGPFPKSDAVQAGSFVALSGAAFAVSALLVHWGSVVRRRRSERGAVAVAA
jgi:hypothetical protein